MSNCFSEHIDSKKRFINRWFGDFPFIDTHHKEYIQCDVVIDDRAYYLRQIQSRQPDAKCIQIKTEINNYHEEYDYMNWDEIDDYLIFSSAFLKAIEICVSFLIFTFLFDILSIEFRSLIISSFLV